MNPPYRSLLVALVILLVARVPPAAAQQAQQAAPSDASTRTVVALDDLVLVALQRNLDLQTRRADNLIVASGVQSAESTFDPAIDVDPQISFGGSNIYQKDGTIRRDGSTTGVNSASLSGTLPFSTSYSASLTSDWTPDLGESLFTNTLTLQLSQPLLKGRGSDIARAAVREAVLAASSADESLSRSIETTIADVENAYWLLGLREAVESNARESLARAQDLLERNRQLNELELLADADLVSARAGVQARQIVLTEATRVREDASDALLFLVYGREASERIRALGVDIATEPPSGDAPQIADVAVIEDQAVAERHDLRAAQYDIEKSQVTLQAAENATLPALDLIGGYTAWTEDAGGFALYEVSRAIDLQFDGFTAGALFTYSIRNNEAEAARTRARLGVQRNELTRSSVENEVRSQVRTAARAVTYGARKLDEARQASALSRQRYQSGLEQLRLGLIDTFRVLQYEEDVTLTQLTEAQALYALANAVTEYQLSVGELDAKYAAGAGGSR